MSKCVRISVREPTPEKREKPQLQRRVCARFELVQRGAICIAHQIFIVLRVGWMGHQFDKR